MWSSFLLISPLICHLTGKFIKLWKYFYDKQWKYFVKMDLFWYLAVHHLLLLSWRYPRQNSCTFWYLWDMVGIFFIVCYLLEFVLVHKQGICNVEITRPNMWTKYLKVIPRHRTSRRTHSKQDRQTIYFLCWNVETKQTRTARAADKTIENNSLYLELIISYYKTLIANHL